MYIGSYLFNNFFNSFLGISIQTDYFEGCTGLIISAEMSEGSGNQSWQHTQLFRQSLDSTDFPFDVKMCLKEQ